MTGVAGGIAGAIAGAIATMVMALILALTIVFLEFARMILSLAIDPFFLISSYTSGGVVDVGWPVVRDLANMFIVLVLVFIGLATALRLREYQAQKTLPLLIGVALLINFTPVILGVIVDAANIIMNFFLSGLSGVESLADRFKSLGAIIANSLSNIVSFDPFGNFELAYKVLIMAYYNIFAGIIFLLFAILFIIRRVAIWMLVILSPLAFVAYILPATRGFWRMWWHQFWQWTIIGVFAAFFLWLGDWMIHFASMEQGEGFLNEVLPFGVALAFLLIGFFVALSTSAMGASGIIAGGQRLTKAGAAWTGRQSRARAAQWGKARLEESERMKGVRKGATALAKAKTPDPQWGKGEKTITGWAKRRAAWGTRVAATPFYASTRAAGQAVGPGFEEAQRKAVAQAESAVEKDKVDTVVAKLRAAPDWATKVGYLNRLVKQPGDLDLAIGAGLTAKEIDQIRGFAEKYDAHKDLEAALPSLPLLEARMRKAAKVDLALEQHTLEPPQRIALAKAYGVGVLKRAMVKPSRAANISREILQKDKATGKYLYPAIIEGMVRTWDGRPTSEFIKSHGPDAMEAIESTIESSAKEENMTPEQWLGKNNPRLLKYMRSQAGQGAGFSGYEKGSARTAASGSL